MLIYFVSLRTTVYSIIVERITLYCRTTSGRGFTNLRFRLSDGRAVSLFYSTKRKVSNADLELFTSEGIPKQEVKEYNHELEEYIQEHIAAIRKAYQLIRSQKLEISSAVLAKTTDEILHSLHQNSYKDKEEPLVDRIYRYIDEYYGSDKPKHYCQCALMGFTRKLERFLTIKGNRSISPGQMDARTLVEFGDFILEEYMYVPNYPNLYSKIGTRRYPSKAIKHNSVVVVMKFLRSFFNHLVSNGELFRSPFSDLNANDYSRLTKQV